MSDNQARTVDKNIRTGLWQSDLDGSFIKVISVGLTVIRYSDEGCSSVYDMGVSDLLGNYRLYSADKIMPVQRKHAHYFKNISDSDEMDTYLFCRVWKVKDDSGALHHALKKLMDAGKRGNKDKTKDVTEARDTLNRYLEIEAMFVEVSE